MSRDGRVNSNPDRCGPRRAMVLAAGLGLRMRPITETCPKPLVAVAGRTLLDRVLDRLEEAGVEDAIVNVHHLGAIIERHLQGRRRPRIGISREDALLETGGGVARALPRLGDRPFFVINSDALWFDGSCPTLAALAASWDERRMDGLLLVCPTGAARGGQGLGDFFRDAEGRLVRRGVRDRAPFVFAGVQILHPRLFDDAPAGAFSLNVLYDRAIERRRLFGRVQDGPWFHVGTPKDLAVAEAGVRRFQDISSAQIR